MAPKWIPTQYPGVRYREHPTRKHGIQPDRYFNVRFQVAGKSVNEGYGWASEGMSASKAAILMAELKEEKRTGKGTGKLADRRMALQEIQDAAIAQQTEQDRLSTTYHDFFQNYYWPHAKSDKSQGSTKREEQLHRLWINPAIGERPIHKVTSLDVERVKKQMIKAGKSARTVHYGMAAIRMVINHAALHRYFEGRNPVKDVRKPKYDNRRIRFLNHHEADTLLQAIPAKSIAVHDMTLLSLHCGLRAGEIFSLTWNDVDLTHNLINVKNTKSGKTRTVTATSAVKRMLERNLQDDCNGLVFPDRNGKRRKIMSKTFVRLVEDLGFNAGIDDRRQKVTFHTCRHTFASWLVMSGVDLYTVQKMMGHSSIAMTERYAHLSPDHFSAATQCLEDFIDGRRIQGKSQQMLS